MKISCQSFCLSLIFSFLFLSQLNAQALSEKTTIILLRHAEKDTSNPGSTMMQANPDLSLKGKQRAEKLLEILKQYSFSSIFSTNFNRTRNTVLPIAHKLNIDITIYDPKNQQVFAEHLKTLKAQTILVVGHSNTIPTLVNLLIGQSKYPNLTDDEYDKIWILELEAGKIKETQIQY